MKHRIKISPNWDCDKSFDWLADNTKFAFTHAGHNGARPRIVLKEPIGGYDCIEIDYDNKGIITNGISVFNPTWGENILDSSKDAQQFIKNFLIRENAESLIYMEDLPMKTEKTIPTIDEMNLEIGAALGYPTEYHWWHHPSKIDGLPESTTLERCRFHSSWDWFMPAAKFILPKLQARKITRTSKDGFLTDTYYDTKPDELRRRIEAAILAGNLKKAHQYLYESITYLKEKGEKK